MTFPCGLCSPLKWKWGEAAIIAMACPLNTKYLKLGNSQVLGAQWRNPPPPPPFNSIFCSILSSFSFLRLSLFWGHLQFWGSPYFWGHLDFLGHLQLWGRLIWRCFIALLANLCTQQLSDKHKMGFSWTWKPWFWLINPQHILQIKHSFYPIKYLC